MSINHTGRSADLYTETFAPGARVMAGQLDGHDHGTIISRYANTYEVAWDFSQVRTSQDGSILQAEIAEADCDECRAFDNERCELGVDDEERIAGNVASTLSTGRVVRYAPDHGYTVQPLGDNYPVWTRLLGEAVDIGEGRTPAPARNSDWTI